jgi:hypothetical protein
MARGGLWPLVLAISAFLLYELLWAHSQSVGQLVDSAKVWFRSVSFDPCYSNLANTAPLSEHVLSKEPLLSQFSESVPYVHHSGHSKFTFFVSLP